MEGDENTEPGLNFEAAQIENAAVGASREFAPVPDAVLPLVAILAYLATVAFFTRRFVKMTSPRAEWPMLSSWPLGLRAAIAPLLTSFALTHAFSAGSVYYNTTVANPSTLEYFANVGVGRLLGLSHAHLFAHAAMYFIVAALFQVTRAGRLQKILVPQVALWAGVFDIVSWWGLKKLSPNFEALSALNGTAFSVAFLWMAFFIAREASTNAPASSKA